MELNEALSRIAEIRERMAREQVFRGYRAAPAAMSGFLAATAACFQATALPLPAENLPVYLALWVGAAGLSIVAAGMAMWWRLRRSSSPLTRQLTVQVVEQMVPCLLAGAMLTAVIAWAAPEAAWLLPGLWQILYSLGLFATCRSLPRPCFAVAAFYLLAGVSCLMFARGTAALAPWAMGVPFAIGQLAAAVVLYWTLERGDEQA